MLSSTRQLPRMSAASESMRHMRFACPNALVVTATAIRTFASFLVTPTHQQHSSNHPFTSGSESARFRQAAPHEGQAATGDDKPSRAPAAPGALYSGHVPTSALQKGVLAVGSALAALCNPTRDDMVATLGETTGAFALEAMHRRMLDDPVGQRILRTKPRISHETLSPDRLRRLPPEAFGRVYIDFMDAHQISAETRKPVRFVDDPELAYVMQRYREVHDFWHALVGMPISVEGEVAVKWLEAVQTGLPVAGLSAAFGPLKLSWAQKKRLLSVYIPWAIECGTRARFLLNVMYENELETDVTRLRESLGIIVPPPL